MLELLRRALLRKIAPADPIALFDSFNVSIIPFRAMVLAIIFISAEATLQSELKDKIKVHKNSEPHEE
jgi:hypothetical protein